MIFIIDPAHPGRHDGFARRLRSTFV